MNVPEYLKLGHFRCTSTAFTFFERRRKKSDAEGNNLITLPSPPLHDTNRQQKISTAIHNRVSSKLSLISLFPSRHRHTIPEKISDASNKQTPPKIARTHDGDFLASTNAIISSSANERIIAKDLETSTSIDKQRPERRE